jgi:peptidase S41-like protein
MIRCDRSAVTWRTGELTPNPELVEKTHMRCVLTALLVFATVAAAAQAPEEARRQIDNVAAFARLYGVVRYFYPSDAAETIDWDRFAVLGVGRVRNTRDLAALETALEGLFNPLGPKLEIASSLAPAPPVGPINPAHIVWQHLGPGIVDPTARSPYSSQRTNRSSPVALQTEDVFVTLMQNVPATDLRGKRVRLRGRARVSDLAVKGWAGFWVRVDRGGQQIGFFDNMHDRPIRQTEWREYIVEGAVADDAANVAFGALASGSVTADFDAIELAVADGGDWKSLQIRDPGFEAPGDARASGWIQAGSSKNPQVAKAEGDAADGQRFLRMAANSGGSSSTTRNTRTPTGAHVDIDLIKGLRARVPLMLTDDDARTSSIQSLREVINAITGSEARSDLDVRLADVVVAWNVFRHFYPYWEEAQVNWDSRLQSQLEFAYRAQTREEHLQALQQLVADARDGHGNVIDTVREPSGMLPIDIRAIGGRLVVIASSVPDDVPVGAVVISIDRSNAAERLESAMRHASGTTQWRGWRATRQLTTCVRNSSVTLTTEFQGRGTREVSVPCGAQRPPERRPEAIAEVASAIWYVDLTRGSMAQLQPALSKLAGAKGVIFDVRGYPTDAGAQILPYLLAEQESDRWMHVAHIAGPFGQVADWQSVGWNLTPATPRIGGRRVFLTDGRAISYAESVMGYVKDRKLGTIIGSTTAGANGNVVRFVVPGRFAITFTGMRVTGHDGRTPLHLAGVQPDMPLEPTIGGLLAGRDELLERAIALIRE